MTPLSRFLGRILPLGLVVPALAAIYAAMMIGVLVLGRSDRAEIAYVDVRHR